MDMGIDLRQMPKVFNCAWQRHAAQPGGACSTGKFSKFRCFLLRSTTFDGNF